MLRRTLSQLLKRFNSKHRVLAYKFSKTSKPQSRKWTKEFARDPYVKKARELDYRSRASFKLLEIEARYKLISKAKRIIELGCFPGGWTQILQEHSSKGTQIMGVDLLRTQKLSNRQGISVQLLQGDIFKHETLGKISQYFKGEPANLIVCDVSPHFVGDLDVDHHNIVEMNLRVLSLSEKLLMTGGNLIIKTLHGTDEKQIYDLFCVNFKEVRRVKPSASRAKSAELYYVGLGYKETDFWRKVGSVPAKERTVEKLMEMMPANIRMSPEDITRVKTTLKYQLAHKMIDEEEVISPIEREFITEIKKEMKQENFEAKNKEQPRYTMDDLADIYDKYCEDNAYKYTHTIKLPRTLSGVLEEYEKAKPKLLEEIHEMMEMNGNWVLGITDGNNSKFLILEKLQRKKQVRNL